MQPNQQDPYTQSIPPAQNSGIPEYLHMEAVSGPVSDGRRGKKKLLIGIVLFVMVAVASLGLFASWYLHYNSPQEKFYRALEQNLQVSSVKRVYTVKNTKPVKETSYEVETDFSNSAEPKTHLSYDDAKTSLTATTVKYTGEKIILDRSEYFDKITSASPKSAETGLALGQWGRRALNTSAPYYFDGIDSLQGLNSVQGIVLTGNFSNEQRKELMEFMRSDAVYPVASSKARTESGRQLSDYTLTVDLDKINNLNKKAVSLIGSSQVIALAKSKTENGELRIGVDDVSGRIVTIAYIIKSKGVTTFEKNEVITYPPTPTIEKPAIVNTIGSSN